MNMKPLSEEHKKRIGDANRGKHLPPQSQETKDKRAAANRGQKRTEEQKKRISEANKGRVFSEEHRKNLNLSHKGKHPWNYNGHFATSRNYAEYLEWRRSVLERDDYTCQVCNERGGKLAAHHILDYVAYPEHRHDLENGLTLCRDCHSYAIPPIYRLVKYLNLEQEESHGPVC